MSATYVVCGANKSRGQSLDAVAVDHHKVEFMFGYEVGKPCDCLGEDHILRVAGALVQKLMNGYA